MSKNIQNYFTTGELSQLCKIPRKTLLYYDKLGLITPELVDENGYRYYKRSQLFLLQLILTLRQLDVPIARIKDYLGNRSPQNYRDLFNERIDFFTQEIAHLQAMKTELQNELGKLDHIDNITLDNITLVHEQAQYLYLSNATKENERFKERSSHIARMFTHLQKDTALTTNGFGYIYDTEILQDFSTKHLKHYFYTLNDKLPTPHCHQKPEGDYLTLYFQGVYMFNNKKYLQMLAEYCKEHQLTPISPLYVTSLCDYWLTGDTDKYIYKLALQIK